MGSPTIVDIAAHLGIDKSTVSRALNNLPDVAPGTRAKVLEVARQLGYVANVHAKRLRGWTGKTIGLVLWLEKTRVSDSFYGPLILQLCQAVSEREHDLMIVSVEHHHGENMASVLSQKGVVGALTLGLQMKGTLDALQDSKTPTIQVNNYSDKHPGLGFATSDNREPACRITKHLVDLGHRRFGFIGDPAVISPFRERYQGFRDALSSVNAEDVSHRRWDGASEFARSLLESCPPATAIVAVNDRYAERTIEALRECDLEVPRDVSVTGFDDLARSRTAALTTVRVDLPKLADEAVGALLDLINGSHEIIQRRVPTELILRGTTGPPPGAGSRPTLATKSA